MKEIKAFPFFINAVKSFRKGAPEILKYLLWVLFLISAIILPVFWGITKALMMRRGMNVMTNSTVSRFLLSPDGAVVLVLGALVLFLGIVLELCGFVIISSRSIKGQPPCNHRMLVVENLKFIPKLLHFGGLLLLVYFLLLVPISGSGFKLSFLSIKIPNFIMEFIESKPLYLAIYAMITVGVIYYAFRWVFTFHFMVIEGLDANAAMKKSAALYRKTGKSFFKLVVAVPIIGVIIGLILITLWLVAMAALTLKLDLTKVANRSAMMSLLLIQHMGVWLMVSLAIPYQIHYLSEVFYTFVKDDPEYGYLYDQYPEAPSKVKASMADRLFKHSRGILGLILVGMIVLAIPLGQYFDELFMMPSRSQIVAHRGGGFAAPENSLSGIKEAITLGAAFAEVDVQRTADGHYVLNHDNTLKRATGHNVRVQDLSLEELKGFTLLFKGEPKEGEKIPTLEELLDASKGKIRLFLELKGKTADEKMVDDVVKIVRDKGMEADVVLVSLDYKIIQYIEEKYSSFTSGFIYFLSFGDNASLVGDMLILEEGEATSERVASIQASGKKVVVWTVNQVENMTSVLQIGPDAVITDEVASLKEEVSRYNSQTNRDRMLKLFLDAPLGK